MSKTRKIALLVAFLVIVAGGIYAYHYLSTARPFLKEKRPDMSSKVESEIVETTEPVLCPFEGTELAPGESLYRPIAVMYDNHNAALPHYGISSSCLVFEALAEGGITRLMAVFSHRYPDAVGPVRSARIYFVELALSYNALLSHCGGSPDALSALRRLPIDLDQIRFSGPYWRMKEKKAPHNLLGSIKKMQALAKERKYDLTPPTGEYLRFSMYEEEATTPVVEIHVPFSQLKSYDVKWVYVPQSNDYARRTVKGPYIDKLTGKEVRAKNVVVIYTQAKSRRDPKGRIDIDLNGEGNAIFFVGGYAIPGRWSKEKNKPFKFLKNDGSEIEFNRWLTWIELVPPKKKVTYR